MLAIAGGKGGCGKTTTALGLARALARGGGRPLVVDADTDMPNLHTRAETPREPGLDALAEGTSLARLATRSRSYPGVDVLPAGTATRPIEAVAFDRLRDYRGPVVVDCPAGADEGAVAPIRAADAALVVTTPDSVSVVDAAKTGRIVSSLGTRLVGSVVVRAGGSDGRSSKRDLRTDRPGPDSTVSRSRPPEPVLARVPETDGDPLGAPGGRAAYDRLATAINERNI